MRRLVVGNGNLKCHRSLTRRNHHGRRIGATTRRGPGEIDRQRFVRHEFARNRREDHAVTLTNGGLVKRDCQFRHFVVKDRQRKRGRTAITSRSRNRNGARTFHRHIVDWLHVEHRRDASCRNRDGLRAGDGRQSRCGQRHRQRLRGRAAAPYGEAHPRTRDIFIDGCRCRRQIEVCRKRERFRTVCNVVVIIRFHDVAVRISNDLDANCTSN